MDLEPLNLSAQPDTSDSYKDFEFEKFLKDRTGQYINPIQNYIDTSEQARQEYNQLQRENPGDRVVNVDQYRQNARTLSGGKSILTRGMSPAHLAISGSMCSSKATPYGERTTSGFHKMVKLMELQMRMDKAYEAAYGPRVFRHDGRGNRTSVPWDEMSKINLDNAVRYLQPPDENTYRFPKQTDERLTQLLGIKDSNDLEDFIINLKKAIENPDQAFQIGLNRRGGVGGGGGGPKKGKGNNVAQKQQVNNPKYDVNKNIVDRKAAAKLSMPDLTNSFNKHLNDDFWGTFEPPKSSNGKYLYDGKIVSKEFFEDAKNGVQMNYLNHPLSDFISGSPHLHYSDESTKAGYRMAEGKNPWMGEPLKYIDAFNNGPFKMPNGDVVSSSGLVIPKRFIDTILWFEYGKIKDLINKNVSIPFDKNKNWDWSIGKQQQKPSTIENAIKQGYFPNLKPYYDQHDQAGRDYIIDYISNNPEEAVGELLASKVDRWKDYIDLTKDENFAVLATLYNQREKYAPHTNPKIESWGYGIMCRNHMYLEILHKLPPSPKDYTVIDMDQYNKNKYKSPTDWDKTKYYIRTKTGISFIK